MYQNMIIKIIFGVKSLILTNVCSKVSVFTTLAVFGWAILSMYTHIYEYIYEYIHTYMGMFVVGSKIFVE
jgi:hypothetical protein